MTTTDTLTFDWGDVAFGSKKPLNNLKATFIAAPRELSEERLSQLVKKYLPEGNIILGLAKEAFVEGLDGQPQFRMLQANAAQPLIDKIVASTFKHKLYSLSYFQREINYILQKLTVRKVIFVNGSWHHSFHLQPMYYTLANQRTEYELVSPFVSEAEARAFERSTDHEIAEDQPDLTVVSPLSDVALLKLTQLIAKQSYDHTNQTGVIIGKRTHAQTGSYKFMTSAYNQVVPYQTYAMHFGSLREKYFSPPNDLNHYDTIHAEVAMMITVQQTGLDLTGATLFINVLPCPTCGRMLAETNIAEVVYQLDHSDGYTLGVLERAGKKVRRIAL